VNIGIGVHIGPLMIGTIGGGAQLDGGVVGDTVNTAARLEGMTKMYGARVLVSDAIVARLTRAHPALRHLDVVRARGKSEPLSLYEILDADGAAAGKRATLALFTSAQRAYRAGDFAAAATGFRAVVAADPQDVAAAFLAARCEGFVAAAPAAWDGVYSLQQK
jgi:hypothetical protein